MLVFDARGKIINIKFHSISLESVDEERRWAFVQLMSLLWRLGMVPDFNCALDSVTRELSRIHFEPEK